MQECSVCHNKKSHKIGIKGDFKINVCSKCKSLFAVRISPEQKEFSYDDYYHEEALDVPEFVYQRLDEIIAEFAPFRKNNRLLDVGCGAGAFLSRADKTEWEVEAVEVSRSSVEIVREKGLKVFHGTLDEANYPDDHFDVVVSIEVIEHIPDPEPVIKEISRILRPGGLFWGTTPHGRGISSKIIGTDWSVICPPSHLQLFSVSGMTEMFKRCGFSEVKIATHGVNPFEIIQTLRKKASKNGKDNEDEKHPEKDFDNQSSSYKLNESFTKSSWRKTVKNILNGTLNITRLGDSIKFWAIK